MSSNYTKNRWNHYDETKTFSENLINDAVITKEKADHIEQGIYDANRVIEIGTIRIANEGELPKISVNYNKDGIVMDFVLPKSPINKDDINKIIEESSKVFVEKFSRVYAGSKIENIEGNDNDIMFILSDDETSVEYIRTFLKLSDGTVSHTDIPFRVSIENINTDKDHIFMTQDERDKLSGISEMANRYVHPDTDGNKHVPANGTQNAGKHLTATGTPGEYEWASVTSEEISKALGYNPVSPDNVTNVPATSTEPGLMTPEQFVKLNNIEEGANNYTHPDTHPASMIVEDENHRFMTDGEKDLLYYNNEEPTIVDHGGIPAGTTFANRPIQEILEDILYPYVAPNVICVVTNPTNGGTYEAGVGTTIANVRVTVTKKSKPITNIEIFATNDTTNALAIKNTGISNGGTFDITISKELRTPITNLKFRAKVTDEKGTVIIADSGAFNIVYPIYYGVAGSATEINEVFVKSLFKMIQVKGNKSINYSSSNQRLVFGYPQSYGTLVKIIDPNNFDITDTFERKEIQITCADGTVVLYYVYVNEPSTVTNFIIKFQY